jgi:hypothetical protein
MYALDSQTELQTGPLPKCFTGNIFKINLKKAAIASRQTVWQGVWASWKNVSRETFSKSF